METAGIVNVVVNAMALTFILNASWKKRFARLDKMFGRRLQIESVIDFLWSIHAILCILHHTTSSSIWLEILLMLLVVQLPNLLLVPVPEVNLKCTLLRPAFSSNRTAWKCSYYVSLKMTFGAGTPPCAHRVSLDVWRFLLWHILQLITSIYVSNKMDWSRLFSTNNPMCIFWPHEWSFRSRKVKNIVGPAKVDEMIFEKLIPEYTTHILLLWLHCEMVSGVRCVYCSLFCFFCHGTNGVNLGFPLFYYIRIYQTCWGTGSWCWHDLLRTNIKELDLSEADLDETDEQALARYEKEEMNMSFLSTPFCKDDWYIIVCYCQCNPCSLYDWYI